MPAIIPSAGVFLIRSSMRAAPSLRGDHQRPVFDERSRIAQVLDIFARGALTGLAPARDRVGPRGVQSDRVALLHFRQVGADVIEIDRLAPRRSRRRATSASSINASGCALENRIAFRHRDLPHDAADVRARSRAPSSSLP